MADRDSGCAAEAVVRMWGLYLPGLPDVVVITMPVWRML